MVTSQKDSSAVEQGIDFEAADRLDEPEITMLWINGKIEQGNHEFREFRNQCGLADEFFLNNFEFSAPDAGTMIRLGTAQSVINTLVSHVKPQFLDISVPPPGPRGQGRTNGEIPYGGAPHG